jgi:hypothetical protein
MAQPKKSKPKRSQDQVRARATKRSQDPVIPRATVPRRVDERQTRTKVYASEQHI